MAAAPRAAGVAVAVALRAARGAGTRARGWRVPGIRAACLAWLVRPGRRRPRLGRRGRPRGLGGLGRAGRLLRSGGPPRAILAIPLRARLLAAWLGPLTGVAGLARIARAWRPGRLGRLGRLGRRGCRGWLPGLARRSLAWTAAARRSPAGRDPCARCSPGRRTPGPRRSGRSRPRGGPCGWVARDRVARGPAARTAGWAGPSPPAGSPLAGAPGRLPCRDGAGRWSRAARWRRCCSRPRPGPGPRGPRGHNRGSSAGRTALAARADRRSACRYPAGRGPPGQGSPVCCR